MLASKRQGRRRQDGSADRRNNFFGWRQGAVYPIPMDVNMTVSGDVAVYKSAERADEKPLDIRPTKA
ncbi:hypothetical protein CDQ92_15530 [Sphingopyxis bauzanensis]|uniref:Uncharacterized protein n=1 Tax=Sphingopyxis bauzanensis TaxID=651663 RepID=A0A246JNW8_9SPHN|nr:hypothetical protein CDQ92_15530 [Sphingopyxis bauzanensis]